MIENICVCFFTHNKKEIYLGFVSQLTQNIVYKMNLWIKLIFYYNLKQIIQNLNFKVETGSWPWKKNTQFFLPTLEMDESCVVPVLNGATQVDIKTGSASS